MYVRRNIRLASIAVDSWREIVIILLWSAAAVYLREELAFEALAVPALPVSVMGIAVSVYLGTKGRASYDRWWEARQALGLIAATSRIWAMQVSGLMAHVADETATTLLRRRLIERHLGALYAFAYAMRGTSRLAGDNRWTALTRRQPIEPPAVLMATPEVFERFVPPDEYAAAMAARTPWVYLLGLQVASVHDLAQRGLFSDRSLHLLVMTVNDLHRAMGQCERIKNTPFPRQMAHFGRVFTWIFVLLIPLALLDTLVHEAVFHTLPTAMTHEFIAGLMPLSLVMGWSFLMMERIGESTEDPFEGGVHDVPLSAICRAIEIEMRDALGDCDRPPPLQPIDDVLY